THRGGHRHQRRGAARLARSPVGLLRARGPRAGGRPAPQRDAGGARRHRPGLARRRRPARAHPRGRGGAGHLRLRRGGRGGRAARRGGARLDGPHRRGRALPAARRAGRARADARRGAPGRPRPPGRGGRGAGDRAHPGRRASGPALQGRHRVRSRAPPEGGRAPRRRRGGAHAGGRLRQLSLRAQRAPDRPHPGPSGEEDPLRGQCRRAGRPARADVRDGARARRRAGLSHRARVAGRPPRLPGHLRGVHELPKAKLVKTNALKLPCGLVGAPIGEIETDIDARWPMAYAAGLGDADPAYLDTLRPGGIVAHPLFPVCYEWPLAVESRARQLGDEIALRSVHATHDVTIHRRARPGDRLRTTAAVVAVAPRRAGAYVLTRYATVDVDGAPVSATDYGSVYLGVACDPEGELPGAPEASGDEAAGADAWTGEVPIPATLAHVYTECARIWNPIHTDPAVA